MSHEGPRHARRMGTRTVGVFDSGVGGLAIASALQRLRADVYVRYVADSAHFPYGEKDRTYVRDRVLACGTKMVEEGCELVVVACNTACSEGLEALRQQLGTKVPVVGVEPPLKPAMAASASRRVAVLATRRTVLGKRLDRLCRTYAKDADVFLVPMVGLADLVETGHVDGPQVRHLLQSALQEPLERGVDVVALGCTHYSFVQGELRQMLPDHVKVVHPEVPVARQAIRRLEEVQRYKHDIRELQSHVNEPNKRRNRIHLGATGCQDTFNGVVQRLISKGALVLDGIVHEDIKKSLKSTCTWLESEVPQCKCQQQKADKCHFEPEIRDPHMIVALVRARIFSSIGSSCPELRIQHVCGAQLYVELVFTIAGSAW